MTFSSSIQSGVSKISSSSDEQSPSSDGKPAVKEEKLGKKNKVVLLEKDADVGEPKKKANEKGVTFEEDEKPEVDKSSPAKLTLSSSKQSGSYLPMSDSSPDATDKHTQNAEKENQKPVELSLENSINTSSKESIVKNTFTVSEQMQAELQSLESLQARMHNIYAQFVRHQQDLVKEQGEAMHFQTLKQMQYFQELQTAQTDWQMQQMTKLQQLTRVENQQGLEMNSKKTPQSKHLKPAGSSVKKMNIYDSSLTQKGQGGVAELKQGVNKKGLKVGGGTQYISVSTYQASQYQASPSTTEASSTGTIDIEEEHTETAYVMDETSRHRKLRKVRILHSHPASNANIQQEQQQQIPPSNILESAPIFQDLKHQISSIQTDLREFVYSINAKLNSIPTAVPLGESNAVSGGNVVGQQQQNGFMREWSSQRDELLKTVNSTLQEFNLLKKKIGWTPLDEFHASADDGLSGVDSMNLIGSSASRYSPFIGNNNNMSKERNNNRSESVLTHSRKDVARGNPSATFSSFPLRHVPVPTPQPTKPVPRTTANQKNSGPNQTFSSPKRLFGSFHDDNISETGAAYDHVSKTISMIQNDRHQVLTSLRRDLMSNSLKVLQSAGFKLKSTQLPSQQWDESMSVNNGLGSELEELKAIVDSGRLQEEVEKRIETLTRSKMFASPVPPLQPTVEVSAEDHQEVLGGKKGRSKSPQKAKLGKTGEREEFEENAMLDNLIKTLNQQPRKDMESAKVDEDWNKKEADSAKRTAELPSRIPGFSFGKAGLKPLPEEKKDRLRAKTKNTGKLNTTETVTDNTLAINTQLNQVGLDERDSWHERLYQDASSPKRRRVSPARSPLPSRRDPPSPSREDIASHSPSSAKSISPNRRDNNKKSSSLPFYNVRLSNAPVFLRRTSIRPPTLKFLDDRSEWKPSGRTSPVVEPQAKPASPTRKSPSAQRSPPRRSTEVLTTPPLYPQPKSAVTSVSIPSPNINNRPVPVVHSEGVQTMPMMSTSGVQVSPPGMNFSKQNSFEELQTAALPQEIVNPNKKDSGMQYYSPPQDAWAQYSTPDVTSGDLDSDIADVQWGSQFEVRNSTSKKLKKNEKHTQEDFKDFVEKKGSYIPPVTSDIQSRISDWVRQEVLGRVLVRQQELLRQQAQAESKPPPQVAEQPSKPKKEIDIEELIESAETIGKTVIMDVLQTETQKVALEVLKQAVESRNRVDAEAQARYLKERQEEEERIRRLKDLEELQKREMEHEERMMLIMEIKKLREAQEAKGDMTADRLRAEAEARKRLEEEQRRLAALKAAEEAERVRLQMESSERQSSRSPDRRRRSPSKTQQKEEIPQPKEPEMPTETAKAEPLLPSITHIDVAPAAHPVPADVDQVNLEEKPKEPEHIEVVEVAIQVESISTSSEVAEVEGSIESSSIGVTTLSTMVSEGEIITHFYSEGEIIHDTAGAGERPIDRILRNRAQDDDATSKDNISIEAPIDNTPKPQPRKPTSPPRQDGPSFRRKSRTATSNMRARFSQPEVQDPSAAAETSGSSHGGSGSRSGNSRSSGSKTSSGEVSSLGEVSKVDILDSLSEGEVDFSNSENGKAGGPQGFDHGKQGAAGKTSKQDQNQKEADISSSSPTSTSPNVEMKKKPTASAIISDESNISNISFRDRISELSHQDTHDLLSQLSKLSSPPAAPQKLRIIENPAEDIDQVPLSTDNILILTTNDPAHLTYFAPAPPIDSGTGGDLTVDTPRPATRHGLLFADNSRSSFVSSVGEGEDASYGKLSGRQSSFLPDPRTILKSEEGAAGSSSSSLDVVQLMEQNQYLSELERTPPKARGRHLRASQLRQHEVDSNSLVSEASQPVSYESRSEALTKSSGVDLGGSPVSSVSPRTAPSMSPHSHRGEDYTFSPTHPFSFTQDPSPGDTSESQVTSSSLNVVEKVSHTSTSHEGLSPITTETGLEGVEEEEEGNVSETTHDEMSKTIDKISRIEEVERHAE
ncbi:hypothetical protein HDV05_001848 [Chytridiales sp. JEL 0842]|nr:hypothetical protein HDV05_001848 [Chytridiales sp. JEL 0842]